MMMDISQLSNFNMYINCNQILLLRFWDLMNTLETTASDNKGKHLHIHLNDVNTKHNAVMARNIVMWKIISAKDFNPNNDGDLAFLWDVWYNAEWMESTKKRFQIVLKDLPDGNLP